MVQEVIDGDDIFSYKCEVCGELFEKKMDAERCEYLDKESREDVRDN